MAHSMVKCSARTPPCIILVGLMGGSLGADERFPWVYPHGSQQPGVVLLFQAKKRFGKMKKENKDCKILDNNNVILDDSFTVEDDFSYFCMYDDLMGVVASHNVELPAIADSCYVDRADVFAL